jgi:hypothetical protein
MGEHGQLLTLRALSDEHRFEFSAIDVLLGVSGSMASSSTDAPPVQFFERGSVAFGRP